MFLLRYISHFRSGCFCVINIIITRLSSFVAQWFIRSSCVRSPLFAITFVSIAHAHNAHVPKSVHRSYQHRWTNIKSSNEITILWITIEINKFVLIAPKISYYILCICVICHTWVRYRAKLVRKSQLNLYHRRRMWHEQERERERERWSEGEEVGVCVCMCCSHEYLGYYNFEQLGQTENWVFCLFKLCARLCLCVRIFIETFHPNECNEV